MVKWPINIRYDRNCLVERVCKHGVGHPDPDSVAYLEEKGIDDGVHGCDGCCLGKNEPTIQTLVVDANKLRLKEEARAEMKRIVLAFFEGDKDKTELWYCTPNPKLPDYHTPKSYADAFPLKALRLVQKALVKSSRAFQVYYEARVQQENSRQAQAVASIGNLKYTIENAAEDLTDALHDVKDREFGFPPTVLEIANASLKRVGLKLAPLKNHREGA